MAGEPGDGVGLGLMVGVEDDHHLAGHQMERVVQGGRLAGLGVGTPVQAHESRRVLVDHAVQELTGPVGRAVVDDDELQSIDRVLEPQETDDEALHDRLLVVDGGELDEWPVDLRRTGPVGAAPRTAERSTL